MEKMRNGLEVQLPAIVDVPDSVNMPYPPEGVFDYLRSMIKPKVDEFAVPQNHFLGGSRFYPRPFNGGQQSRENEVIFFLFYHIVKKKLLVFYLLIILFAFT